MTVIKNLESLYEKASIYLESLDIPRELNGYWNLLNIIMILVTDDFPDEMTMTEIYYYLKEDDGISINAKNWDCQRAIQSGYEKGNKEYWKLMGFNEKPSVKKICVSIANRLRTQWHK